MNNLRIIWNAEATNINRIKRASRIRLAGVASIAILTFGIMVASNNKHNSRIEAQNNTKLHSFGLKPKDFNSIKARIDARQISYRQAIDSVSMAQKIKTAFQAGKRSVVDGSITLNSVIKSVLK